MVAWGWLVLSLFAGVLLGAGFVLLSLGAVGTAAKDDRTGVFEVKK